MNNSILETKLSEKTLTYPILAWSELDSKSALLLISSPDKIQVLEKFQDHNLLSLLNKLAVMINSADFVRTSLEGDESMIAFNIPEFTESNLNWENLLTDIEDAITTGKIGKGLSDKIAAELQANHHKDIAAAAITTIYGSMLYLLIIKASDLGITELMFLGDMLDTERLSAIIAGHLPEHMNLMMLNL